MADISKIKLNDTTYNIKDTTARAQSGSNADSIVNLQENMEQAKSDIQSVDARVKDLEARKPENILGKNYVLIADSYGEYNVFTGFINAVQGNVIANKWVGGAGFTKTGEQSFLTILNSLANSSIVDYVVVFGLYNDSFDVNNLVPKIAEFRTACNIKFPKAQIVIVNEGWSSDVSLQGQFQYMMNKLLANTLARITVINSWKYMHIYANIASDKIHPANNTVGSILGSIAGNILAGSNPDFCYPIQQIAPKYINGWQSYGGTTAPYQEMNNSECLLHFVNDSNHYGIDAGTTIKCNGSNYVEIMEFPEQSGCIIGSGDMLLNVPCILGETSGTYRQASCTLEVYDRKLRVRPFCLNQTGNDFVTISLNSIQWTPCTIRSNINHI